MHSSISEGARTPTKKNSFLELYQMTSYDLAKKKDELVTEKRNPFRRPQEKSETSPLNGLRGNLPSLTLLAAKSPNQIPIDDKKKIPPWIP
ncbi:hypothetical protein TNCV_2653131 [Trichonephila clavipes]|nr:hypothetical protein TNCV_2653131 [Trichonephila clavipes]